MRGRAVRDPAGSTRDALDQTEEIVVAAEEMGIAVLRHARDDAGGNPGAVAAVLLAHSAKHF
jgi:hypothetical protein